MFDSGSFTTSTPLHCQHDSGFYENSPPSKDVTLTPSSSSSEWNYFPLKKKNLFGDRCSNSENITDHQFSNKRKLIRSRNLTIKHRVASLTHVTPRILKTQAVPNESVNFTNVETLLQLPRLFSNDNSTLFTQWDDDSSDETCEKTGNHEFPDCSAIPVLSPVYIWHERQEYLKGKKSCFEHSLDDSGTKNGNNISTSELVHLYYIHRYQTMGLKPSSADFEFFETQLLENEMDQESEMVLNSWKDELEHISAGLEVESKIDLLSRLYDIGAYSIVSSILSYLSGYDIQNVRCVSQTWQKIVFEDQKANRIRWSYFKERQKIKLDQKKKFVNSFQRPSNFRILGSIENIQMKQPQLQKSIKEINFDAFIKAGKCSKKHKPMKCPSCGLLSLQNKRAITKYDCLFCGYEFCSNCLKPYSSWHCCALVSATEKPAINTKKYLKRC